MRRRANSDEEDVAIVFRDTISLALAAFMAVAVLLLPHINPGKKAATEATTQPGNVVVEVRWPDDADADVDTWVLGPNDKPVGYSAKAGNLFNLLRDDRGENDTTPLNYETAFSRGIPDGEYVVNIHCFACGAPIGVFVEVRIGRSGSDLVYSDTITVKPMQELTAISFIVADGKAVPGSESYIFQPLRNRT